MNFSLHYSINYFKNENCFPSILNLFSVIASFSKRFPEKCSRSRANAGYYKKEFEFSFHSRKYWSRGYWLRGLTVNLTKNWFSIKCVTRLQTKTQIWQRVSSQKIKEKNQYSQQISLSKLHESSVTISVFSDISWRPKISRVHFLRKRKHIVRGRLIVLRVAMTTVLSSTTSIKIHSYYISSKTNISKFQFDLESVPSW